MTLARWDPFREMMSLRQAMDRLFEDAWVTPKAFFGSEVMSTPMDVAEDDQNITVKAALPGIKPEEVDISVIGNTLTIRGEHKSEEERKEQTWHRRELSYGRFERTITLPAAVQADKAEATFENGMLSLRLPKAEEAKPKRIQVRSQQPALEGSR